MVLLHRGSLRLLATEIRDVEMYEEWLPKLLAKDLDERLELLLDRDRTTGKLEAGTV